MNVQTAVGWDIHRKFSQWSVVERGAQGEIRVVKRRRLEHADRAAMREELAKLPPETPVAMEGAFGWPWIADLLDELGLDPHLGHLTSYAGLAPLADDSADRHGQRHIAPACNHTLRWAFIEGAGCVLKCKTVPRIFAACTTG